MKRLLFPAILLFFCLSLSAAGRAVRVHGYVYTPEREAAHGAQVYVLETGEGTTVQSDGHYELKFSIEDTATVRYTYIGCDTAYLKIAAKQRNVQRILYLKDASYTTTGVVIEAQAGQTGTMATLDKDKLKLLPSASGDAVTALLSSYGVGATNEMSSQYSVRGGSYDENSIYVNDIEIYRPLLIRNAQQEGLSFINADMVESVQFSAGGFDTEYGDKMSSVLNIRYKKPEGFEANITGSLLGASAYLGHATKNKRFTQMHGIRYKSSDYLLGSLDTKGVYDQRFIDYQTRLTYNFAPKWEFDFLGNFSQNSYRSVPETQEVKFGTIDNIQHLKVYFDGQEKDLFRTYFGAATLKYKPRKDLSLNLMASAFYTQEDVAYDISSEYWLTSSLLEGENSNVNENVLGVGSTVEYARNRLNANVITLSHRGEWLSGNRRNSLKWGASIQREFVEDKINEYQLRDSLGYSLPYDAEGLGMSYNLFADTRSESYRVQAFVQDYFRIPTPQGTVFLTGGVRANYWTFNREFLLSPRMAVSFAPRFLKNFNFRFASGVYYQAPFYKEIKQVQPDDFGNATVRLNRDIKAQRSLHLVLGTDYFFTIYDRPFKLTSEIFYKPADRVTTYTLNNVQVVYSGVNNAKAYSAGIDVKLFGELVPGADSWISFSVMQSKEDVAGDGEGYVSRPNEQRYNFSMFFQDYFPGLPKFKFHLKFIWADGFPFWAPVLTEKGIPHSKKNTNRTTAYRRVDIGITRSFVKGDFRWLDKTRIFSALKSINLGLECFNLLNLGNVASYYWVTDVQGNQHAVPNYLTGRQVNFRLSLDF